MTRPTDAAMVAAYEALERLGKARRGADALDKWLASKPYRWSPETWEDAHRIFSTRKEVDAAGEAVIALADSLASSLAAGQGVGGVEDDLSLLDAAEMVLAHDPTDPTDDGCRDALQAVVDRERARIAPKKCPRCRGDGWVAVMGGSRRSAECAACRGSGRAPSGVEGGE